VATLSGCRLTLSSVMSRDARSTSEKATFPLERFSTRLRSESHEACDDSVSPQQGTTREQHQFLDPALAPATPRQQARTALPLALLALLWRGGGSCIY
jgi:hypothetical protein